MLRPPICHRAGHPGLSFLREHEMGEDRELGAWIRGFRPVQGGGRAEESVCQGRMLTSKSKYSCHLRKCLHTYSELLE